MKNLIYISVFALLLTACGGSKKAINDSEKSTTKTIAKEEVKVIKEVEEVKEEIIEKEVVITEVIKDTTTQIAKEIMNNDRPLEDVVNVDLPVDTEVFNHSVWQNLLSSNVSEAGNVNYDAFKQRKGELNEYIASLGVNIPTDSWTQEDKLAYWMNAYNAMTVDLILRNMPLESIKDIDKPWEQRIWKLGEKWYNLDEIEHQILRKMGDPRIHFGINCASFSCPPLLNEAFTSANVDDKLEFLAKRFINDRSRNHITPTRVEISRIFNWFSKDFKKEGTIIDYLNKYSRITISYKASRGYFAYDWTLNK
jgi:hypothetical protein